MITVAPILLSSSGSLEKLQPLWRASTPGREEVVKLLLVQHEVNPDKPDNTGKTPLWRASRNRHEGVLKLLLLEWDEDKPDKRDNNSITPL